MLAYCDYIADTIKVLLKADSRALEGTGTAILDYVGNPKMDLHPTEGYFMSTKKTILVTDINGKEYKITIEEA
jgi:hypothetical protein|tara:strand:+ start:362 stop:580 length:219 start_codon:yes stop_codon:yes gene_type:complete